MENKYNLSEREAKFLLKKSLVELIHANSRLEKVNTTFPQTKTIVEGMSVSGISMDDVQIILNLKNAYQYILNEQASFTLNVAKKINSFVSYNESLDWGVVRYGDVGIHGVNYTPSIPVEADVAQHIETILSNDLTSTTYRALKYMYYAMRTQIFWDGNKRTALIATNYIMLLNGNGILHIDESHLEVWNRLLSEFYETNNDEAIIEWTYNHCIFGIDYKL
ncbi:Fic family protein [Sporosarcina sp. YIM B06819]|uniref:Fic family protein n=1 Tax=Sporosarcina sp. YIM B06819 TaxID=3081769 RepID=UPI00298D21F3|nr:Fic family protein [Sporosarcina sp. YIM B06819]